MHILALEEPGFYATSLTALRLTLFPERQNWSNRDLIKSVLLTPATIGKPGRRTTLRLGMKDRWPSGWQNFYMTSMR